jgi:hypothetical protein
MKTESSFFRDILHLNGIPRQDVEAFVFNRGMSFGDTVKWWGSGGERQSPHEGLDLLFYRKKSGEIKKLVPGTLIPAVFNGEVVLVIDDFLGKSLLIRHSTDIFDAPIYSLSAHIKPLQKIMPGTTVAGGEPVAEIAELPGNNFSIYPHLHLSLALIENDFELDRISWESISKSEKIKLLDPVDYFRGLFK